MSEKRFKLDFDYSPNGNIMDRKDKYGQYCRLYDFGEIGRQQIVDLLNVLNDENEQLQEKVKELESILADDIVRKSEIKEVWKQRTEKR